MSASSRARDAALAAAAAGASLALFACTLQPDFGGPEDTPKFQFIGYVLGIPHPPGYPLYVLLSHAFAWLPIGTIAYRANLFSAVMAAAACSLAYVTARQLGASRWTALCAALGLATGASFWRSAVFAEVYSLAAVMAGLTITLLLDWGARGGGRRLVAAFGAFAFGLGNHLTILGLVPAFAVYVLARGRRVWSFRVVMASALLLILGLAQYGLIVARTRQDASYLETRADSVTDLFGVVTAERFADQRFAFGAGELFTAHLPALASLVARELGAAGTVFFLAGAIAGFRRANAALVLGAATGMFVMVLNLAGDLKGFITPLMVLLWPLAAVGLDALARRVRSIPRAGSAAARLVLAAAALLPITNLSANYRDADQSGQAAQGRFLRSLFSQLPVGSGIVAEDYAADMAWSYYQLTGEAGPDRRISRVGFDAASVRRVAREGHRVFAFANAATFLAAEGLRFRRAPVEGPPLTQWLARLPRGSVVVGAMAKAPFPADLSAIGHADARPPGRLRSFEAFAVVAGRRGSAWRREEDEVSFGVNAESLAAPAPAFAGALVVSSGAGGARVDLAGRTVAYVESGVALAVFAPDGTLVRALEIPEGQAQGVQYAEAVYELAGESRCAALTTDTWTDVGGALASGSWVTTMPVVGSVVIESVVPGAGDVRARSAVLLGDGGMQTTIAHDLDGDILTTELRRPADRRPVFRLALDRPLSGVRARLRAHGAQSSITVCAFDAVQTPFERGETSAVLRADFESEPYFGAGWGDTVRTPTGPIRYGDDKATLFLPLEQGRAYRLFLDLAADAPVSLDVTLHAVHVGVCDPHAAHPCELSLSRGEIQGGVNTLMLSLPGGKPVRPRVFTFRGARIQVTPGSP